MKIIFCFISVLVFFSCTNSAEKPKQVASTHDSDSVLIDTPNAYSSWQEPDTVFEAIPEDSVLINGKLPFYATQKQLLKTLGKPDSIVSYAHECGGYFEDRTIKRYYYGKTVFEANKDTAVLTEMYFTAGNFTFKTPKSLLSAMTTLDDIKRAYPKSFKEAYVTEDTSPIIAISPDIRHSESTLAWHLFFEQGKLVKIEYYIGC